MCQVALVVSDECCIYCVLNISAVMQAGFLKVMPCYGVCVCVRGGGR